MRKIIMLVLAFSMIGVLFGCSSVSQEAAADIKTKEVEIFNDLLQIPENAVIEEPDGGSEDTKFIFLDYDENNPDNKWKNYFYVYIIRGANTTPNITFSQGRTVLAQYTDLWIGIQSNLENIEKTSISLNQTPAYHITADLKEKAGTFNAYTAMNSYHDIVTFFYHRSKDAKTDYTNVFESMIQNAVFQDLNGDTAFVEEKKEPSHSSSSSGSSASSSSSREGLCQFKVGNTYVCDKKATNGPFCKEHADLLMDAYNDLTGK